MTDHPTHHPTAGATRWTVAVNRFLAEARGRDLEASTIAGYQYHLARLVARIAAEDPTDVGAEDLQRWLEHLPGNDATVEQSRKVARLFFDWAAEARLLRSNPYAELADLPVSARWHPSWGEGIASMCTQLRDRGRTDLTVHHCELHVAWLAAALPDVDAWEVTVEQLAGWVDGHYWSANTRRKVLTAPRAFYAQGINDGVCSRSPLAGCQPCRSAPVAPRSWRPRRCGSSRCEKSSIRCRPAVRPQALSG